MKTKNLIKLLTYNLNDSLLNDIAKIGLLGLYSKSNPLYLTHFNIFVPAHNIY